MQLIIENQYGEQLDLSAGLLYDITSITGLTPPMATINRATIATKDGSVFNSSRLNERNIVITVVPRRNIESSRINLYKFVRVKRYIKLYLANGSREVWIDGYVESFEGDLYSNPQTMQISIICPDPFFKSRTDEVVSFSATIDAFEFPFETSSAGIPISIITTFSEVDVYNASDDETGVLIELYAHDAVTGPIIIYNQTTGESFTINYNMTEGDRILLNTRRGKKSLVFIHDGAETNIINYMAKNSKWFTLKTGDNIFAYTCGSGASDLTVTLTLQTIFEGV